jgi:hypothetical protein
VLGAFNAFHLALFVAKLFEEFELLTVIDYRISAGLQHEYRHFNTVGLLMCRTYGAKSLRQPIECWPAEFHFWIFLVGIAKHLIAGFAMRQFIFVKWHVHIICHANEVPRLTRAYPTIQHCAANGNALRQPLWCVTRQYAEHR